MDSTLSVSKGIFVFKNSTKPKTKANKRKPPASKSSVIDQNISSQLWYQTYFENWTNIKYKIDELQSTLYEDIMRSIAEFIYKSYGVSMQKNTVIPTAVILTGINQSDHLMQFQVLSKKIINNVSSHVVILLARDCPTVKATIEVMISKFVEEEEKQDDDEDDGEDDDVDEKRIKKQFRKSQLTMSVLKTWYLEKYREHPRQNMVVILPDFELFNPQVLQDLIMILSTYIPELPFVLIFGVATSISTIYDVLPYNVLRNIQLKTYQSESATLNLNKILDNIIWTPSCSFHLSGKSFQFLIDIFIFYDFSLHGMIQGFKYLMLEHYSQGNIYSLCTAYNDTTEKRVRHLTPTDIEEIRHLMSFRAYVESIENSDEIIALLTQDDYVKRKLPILLRNIHCYFFNFHLSLEILLVFVNDLPKTPLGKQIRELYSICFSNNITAMPDYKECIKLIQFHSKEEILSKLDKSLVVIEKYKCLVEKKNEIDHRNMKTLFGIEEKLKNFHNLLTKAGLESDTIENKTKTGNVALLSDKMNRHQMMDKLLQAAKEQVQPNESMYMKAMKEFIEYLEINIIQENLKPADRGPPLIELFVFTDITTARQHLLGTPRASIHTALNNPNDYLQCTCCDISNIDAMNLISTMPDLSIAYKLHLECGKMINLFDWLQAFRTVISLKDVGDDADDYDFIDPRIQAQFTRAVAELQFIGFIKSSKRKTDHVSRLAW